LARRSLRRAVIQIIFDLWVAGITSFGIGAFVPAPIFLMRGSYKLENIKIDIKN
jgi:hypothetical protein